jgi:hypothetical protein
VAAAYTRQGLVGEQKVRIAEVTASMVPAGAGIDLVACRDREIEAEAIQRGQSQFPVGVLSFSKRAHMEAGSLETGW